MPRPLFFTSLYGCGGLWRLRSTLGTQTRDNDMLIRRCARDRAIACAITAHSANTNAIASAPQIGAGSELLDVAAGSDPTSAPRALAAIRSQSPTQASHR